ncbi:MAG: hypothetical protein NVS1B6_11000 [Steroidobacteraceae bacterium]
MINSNGKSLGERCARCMLACMLFLAAGASHADAQASCDIASVGLAANSQDNSAALERAFKSCAGRTIRFPPGTFVFRPSGFAQGFTVPGNTTLQGAGALSATPTILKIADSGTFASLLWIRNSSRVTIKDIRFEGSHYESGCARRLDYGHAIYLYSDGKASASIEDINITGNVFRDFNGLSWLTLNAEDHSPGMGLHSLIAIAKNSFLSDSALVGGCADKGIGYSVSMISIHGSDDSAHGMIENVSVASNTFEAGYVKQAVAIWSGTARLSVQYNTIRDAGLHLATETGELGRYAVNVYNSAHEKPGLHPSDIHIVGNTILNPVSCGVYVAGGRKIDIAHNKIAGQSDPNDGTLPKGAIALNHVDDASVSDNDLQDNHIGIATVVGSVRLGTNHIAPRAGGVRSKTYRDDINPPQIER